MKLHRGSALLLSLVLLSSCTAKPVRPEVPPEPPIADVPSTPVQVDWSKLQQAKEDADPDHDGGRWYAETMLNLVPQNDYGPLYAYVGATVQSVDYWIDESGTEQSWLNPSPTPVYGLMTREGKIVTDPIYQGVYQPTYRHGSQVTAHPVLLLSQADASWNEFGTNGQRYAVAAKDGSWCTEFEFWTYTLNGDALLLLGPSGATYLDPISGARRDHPWESLGISRDELPLLLTDIMWMYGFRWIDAGAFLGCTDPDDWENTHVRLFHPQDGSLTIIPRQQWDALLDADQQTDWDQRDRWEFIATDDQLALSYGDESYVFPRPAGLDQLHSVEVRDGLAILNDYSHSEGRAWLYRLTTGALLAQANYIGFIQDVYSPDSPAFVHIMYDNGSQALYGPNFTPFLSYPKPHPSAQVVFIYQDGLIFARNDETFFGCYDAESGKCILYRNLNTDD